ncbi:putative RlpA-like domain superfamily, kiwellin, partial [Tanacetum coccineum]
TSNVYAQSNTYNEELREKIDHSTHDKFYSTYKRLLLASRNTRATLVIADYDKGGDSGGPADCDGKYHSNEMFIVSLPYRWYNDGKKCFKFININYKGKNVQPMVVDESNTDNTIVASKAVWRFLQVPESEWGDLEITWSWA